MMNVLLNVIFPSVKRRKYAPFGRIFVSNLHCEFSTFKTLFERSATSFPSASNTFKTTFWPLKAGSWIVANPVAGFGEMSLSYGWPSPGVSRNSVTPFGFVIFTICLPRPGISSVHSTAVSNRTYILIAPFVCAQLIGKESQKSVPQCVFVRGVCAPAEMHPSEKH